MDVQVVKVTRQELFELIEENFEHLSECCSPDCEVWDWLDSNLFLLGYQRVNR